MACWSRSYLVLAFVALAAGKCSSQLLTGDAGLLNSLVATGSSTVGGVLHGAGSVFSPVLDDVVKTVETVPLVKNVIDSLAESLVSLNLYTSADSEQHRIFSDVESIANSQFDRSLPTTFCTHGYLSHAGNGTGCSALKNELIKEGGCNVVVVDWSLFDSKLYPVSTSIMARAIGRLVARTIQAMKDVGAVSEFRLIGHSLGAHIMGEAGTIAFGPNEGVIIGLDPAGPQYTGTSSEYRLSPDDAGFVVALHTDGGLLGTMQELGDMDIYLNGGSHPQPGCTLDAAGACSHCLALEAFVFATQHRGALVATQCPSREDLLAGACDGNPTSDIGNGVDKRCRGKYFVENENLDKTRGLAYCYSF